MCRRRLPDWAISPVPMAWADGWHAAPADLDGRTINLHDEPIAGNIVGGARPTPTEHGVAGDLAVSHFGICLGTHGLAVSPPRYWLAAGCIRRRGLVSARH